MAAKKSRRQMRIKRKQVPQSAWIKSGEHAGGRMTLLYLRTIWNTHPLKPTAILTYMLITAGIAFFASLAAAKGFLSQFIIQIANENMAPRTALLIGAVCLCVLSGVVAFRGPFTARSGWTYNTFAVKLPAISLFAWGTICGISLGALGAAIVLGSPISSYVRELSFRFIVFTFGFTLFLMITITTADAPMYNTTTFRRNTRKLAGLMFFLLVGWFVSGALYVGN